MKTHYIKAALLISAICVATVTFAQTPGSSPGSPTAPGSENVNPRVGTPGGPGGPGYDAPAIDITRPNTNTNSTVPGSSAPIDKNAGDPDKKGLIEKDADAKHIKEDTSIKRDVRKAKKEKNPAAAPKTK